MSGEEGNRADVFVDGAGNQDQGNLSANGGNSGEYFQNANDGYHQDQSQQNSEKMNQDQNSDNSRGSGSSSSDRAQKPGFKVFVGGLNRVTTANSLRSTFEKYGAILDCEVLFDKFTGRSRGFGFITYENRDAVDAVTKATVEVDGTTVEVRRAIPREEARQSGQSEKEQSGRVFVGGLGDNVNDDMLRSHFEKFGELYSATVMMDRNTNRSRGFAFVIFKNTQDADKAIGQHTDLGASCEAKRAQPRNFADRGRGGGGYPGGYGRRMDYGGYGGGRGGYREQYGDSYGSPAGGYGGGYQGYNQYYNPYYAAYYAQMSSYGGGYSGGGGGYSGGGGGGYGVGGGYDGNMVGSPGPGGVERGSRMGMNRSTPY